MTKLLFTDFQACISSNGHISENIKVTRSVHQGCPISAFLSLAFLQNMNSLIKSNDKIKRLSIHDKKQLLSQSLMIQICF